MSKGTDRSRAFKAASRLDEKELKELPIAALKGALNLMRWQIKRGYDSWVEPVSVINEVLLDLEKETPSK